MLVEDYAFFIQRILVADIALFAARCCCHSRRYDINNVASTEGVSRPRIRQQCQAQSLDFVDGSSSSPVVLSRPVAIRPNTSIMIRASFSR